MRKKIYVSGSSGLVGSRFLELLSSEYEALTPEIDQLDIRDKEALRKFFKEENPMAVVNFAAFTDVRKAENQRGDKNGDCWRTNVEGVRNLVSQINPDRTHFIQISTDLTYSGLSDDPGPYPEDHQPEIDSSKLTWYGFTKAEAERVILDRLGNKATILRLIYPVRAKFETKLDYLRKPLALFDQGKLYPLFNDQQISITFIDEASQAIEKIIKQKAYGVYHASSPDTTTPYEIVSYLLKKARGETNAVQPSSMSQFLKTVDNPVRYPKFGGLRVEKTQERLGMKFTPWRKIVDLLVSQGLT